MDEVVYVHVLFESQEKSSRYFFRGDVEEIRRAFTLALKNHAVLTLSVGDKGHTVLDMSKVLRFSVTSNRESALYGLPTADEDRTVLTADSISVLSRR